MIERLVTEGALDALDLRFARAVARLAGVADPDVLLAAALANHAPTRGDVAVDLARPLPEAPDLPPADAWVRKLLAQGALVRAPGEDARTPLVLDGTLLYLDRYWAYQQRLVAAVRARARRAPTPVDEPTLRADLDRMFDRADGFDADPRRAAEAAVRSALTLVAGGPGTGKTATVVRILALLAHQARARGESPPRVALAAPTGKAAARLEESIRDNRDRLVPEDLRAGLQEEASTIHRLLGVRWGTARFRHDLDNPLPHDVVVVDEASMVDLPLMTKLVEAVRPDARLILLGDPDQLVSVEMGSVLGDLCAAAEAGAEGLARSTVRLSHTWRYGPDSGIRVLADAINAGDAPRALDVLASGDHPDVIRLDVAPRDLERSLRGLVIDAWRPALEAAGPAEALAAFGRFRVLCAHRHGVLGVSGLNAAIEGWLADAGLIDPSGSAWYDRRPVMVTSNDPQRRLYNGDVGIVLAEGDGRRVWFPDSRQGVRGVAAALVPPHETVFATTVHKSQGSEHEHVLVVLPERVSPVVTRELLYTAVTRARERVTVVGSAEIVAEAIGRRVERLSGLKAALLRP